MPLIDIHGAFIRAGHHSLDVIRTANVVDSTGNYINAPEIRRTIIEGAVLKYFVAWETLLEDSFIAFLLGEAAVGGRVWVRYAQPTDAIHARQILKGVQQYTDWSTPEKVLVLADAYFVDAGPYRNAINNVISDWTDFKVIRNAAAHVSGSTTQKLDGLASRRLKTPTIGISVERFVLAGDPSAPPNTVFDSLQGVLMGAAQLITH
jgi:hypothetical protein